MMLETNGSNLVMVAPLDWGLGHATRCIPIIKALLEQNYRVLLVTSGRPLHLLRTEFPECDYVDLPSYNIYYQKRGSFLIKLTVQLRKILGGILREKKVTRQLIKSYSPIMIISDNRYGVRSQQVHTVFITHQMMIKIPGSRLIEWVVYQWLTFQHRRFHRIWIPDTGGEPNLSGDLAHRYPKLPNARFVGALNRFNIPLQLPEPKQDILCILSGPEPQRSIFERRILDQAAAIGRKFVLVRGLSESHSDQWISDHIRVISHVGADALMELILQSKVIISRGGYTTLMDLAPLSKHCIFVPTPGQTEQEYLVEQLASRKLCVHAPQKHFSLALALAKLDEVQPFFVPVASNTFHSFLEDELAVALQRKV